MTTIELNNSYYLIITYFLRKFLSPFKLIPLEEYRILSSSSSSSSIRSVNENINFSNTNSKLLSLRKKNFFLLRRSFSNDFLEISSSSRNLFFPRNIEDISWCFFFLAIFPGLEMGRVNFETVLLILERRYSKILHHRSATRFINMISRSRNEAAPSAVVWRVLRVLSARIIRYSFSSTWRSRRLFYFMSPWLHLRLANLYIKLYVNIFAKFHLILSPRLYIRLFSWFFK